ncbi:MAG: ATP-binding protein [Bacteroidales bacterium]|nr:ATP-binding protein [Bacteroidales bacterium]
MRYFNTTGICYPDKHYMVDISPRLADIERRVAKGEYITINRGRQYGKTTTLFHLAKKLMEKYVVFSISFEDYNQKDFNSIESIAFTLLETLQTAIDDLPELNVDQSVKDLIVDTLTANQEKREIIKSVFAKLLTDICRNSSKPIVLIIDEVDNASNYESFIELLRMLRSKYLKRATVPTFQSVILAGVYDIKNLKLKVRPDSDHQYNSPWNIAVAFTSDMSLPSEGINQMLQEYENDHHTGMDISEITQLITDYTSGYPFFVSRVCQLIDEQNLSWSKEGVINAVKILLREKNTFFDEIFDSMNNYSSMKTVIEMLLNGQYLTFNCYAKGLDIASTFNIISDDKGQAKIANKIFENRFKNYFDFEKSISTNTAIQTQG